MILSLIHIYAVADVEKKFKGEGRVLIRPSGTEPLVRVMIEGKDQKVIDEEARKLGIDHQNNVIEYQNAGLIITW